MVCQKSHFTEINYNKKRKENLTEQIRAMLLQLIPHYNYVSLYYSLSISFEKTNKFACTFIFKYQHKLITIILNC